jgi:glycosyltransferase involved in cell wall biosynthesis
MTEAAKAAGVRVTVGIPCYNRPAGLKRTLEAVLAQTHRNLEVIVSDNCSPNPEVGDLARAAASADPRVRYVRQPQNIGPHANFRFLLEQATGEMFMWAADDDLWQPTFIEALAGCLRANGGAILAFCRPAEHGAELERTQVYDYPAALSSPDVYDRMQAFMAQQDFAFGKASLVYGLHRTQVLREVLLGSGYWHDQAYASDNVLLINLLAKGPAAFVNEELYSAQGVVPRPPAPGDPVVSPLEKGRRFALSIAKRVLGREQYLREQARTISSLPHDPRRKQLWSMLAAKQLTYAGHVVDDVRAPLLRVLKRMAQSATQRR